MGRPARPTWSAHVELVDCNQQLQRELAPEGTHAGQPGFGAVGNQILGSPMHP